MILFTAVAIVEGEELSVLVTGVDADDALRGLERQYGVGNVTIGDAVLNAPPSGD